MADIKLEARITHIVAGDKLKAYASVLIDDWFLVKGLKVIDGINGRFVAMPCTHRDGVYYDTCFPIKKEGRAEIERVVLGEYDKKLEGL